MKPKDSTKAAWFESEKLKDERISLRGWDVNRRIGNLLAPAWDATSYTLLELSGKEISRRNRANGCTSFKANEPILCCVLNPTSQVQKYLEAGK